MAFMRGMLKELNGETKRKPFGRMLGKDYFDASTAVPMLKDALNGLNPTSPLTLISLD